MSREEKCSQTKCVALVSRNCGLSRSNRNIHRQDAPRWSVVRVVVIVAAAAAHIRGTQLWSFAMDALPHCSTIATTTPTVTTDQRTTVAAVVCVCV